MLETDASNGVVVGSVIIISGRRMVPYCLLLKDNDLASITTKYIIKKC